MYKFDSSSCDEYAHMFYHIFFYPEKLRTSFIRTKGVKSGLVSPVNKNDLLPLVIMIYSHVEHLICIIQIYSSLYLEQERNDLLFYNHA